MSSHKVENGTFANGIAAGYNIALGIGYHNGDRAVFRADYIDC